MYSGDVSNVYVYLKYYVQNESLHGGKKMSVEVTASGGIWLQQTSSADWPKIRGLHDMHNMSLRWKMVLL